MCLTLTQYRVRTGVSATVLSFSLFSKVLDNYKHHKNTHRENFTGTAHAIQKLTDPLINQNQLLLHYFALSTTILNQFSGGWLRGSRTFSGALQRSSLGTQLLRVGPHHGANIINSSFSETSRDQPKWVAACRASDTLSQCSRYSRHAWNALPPPSHRLQTPSNGPRTALASRSPLFPIICVIIDRALKRWQCSHGILASGPRDTSLVHDISFKKIVPASPASPGRPGARLLRGNLRRTCIRGTRAGGWTGGGLNILRRKRSLAERTLRCYFR